ncbi:transmembrane protein 41 homolog isoform X2 [Manduca sexta]|uniref:VTT domain-containing protein n=1 Tax=Manduca sexta TaxID=7130 RepID=A0A921Z3J0_MANSE|nr:transmembrane protein 41 homolog isoform X2 [Manduca sexta]KAG6450718.1 hypothetical protein O3G_MSEX006764 [Manduca sexta]
MCTTDHSTRRRPHTSDIQDSDMDTVNVIDTKPNNISTFKTTILVIIIFVSSLIAMRFVFKLVPDLDEEERQYLRMPLDLEDAKQLGWLLNRYKDKYFYQVLFGVSFVYIFLQTFAIPGSIFLSILSGFLFPFPVALTLVCSCSAIGASLCFFISNLLARRLVLKYLPTRAAEWSTAVNKHKDNLLNYIIFLRVTPFLPNWFINMTAPVVGVPLKPFALGTFIGVAPPSFVAIQAGQTLHTLTSTSDAWSWTSITVLSGFALISLIPVFLKDKLRKKFE